MSGSPPGHRTEPEHMAELADLLDDDVARATFMRGLAIGALVGAAIAGTLLQGRRRRRGGRAREVARFEPPPREGPSQP
jgi:hypothetical protein